MKCVGIQSLCNVLHRAVNRLSQGPEYSEIAVALINVLEYVVAGNGKNINKIPSYHEFHENFHSVTFDRSSLYWSIHTKDESKRGIAFAFIFGVN